MIYFPCNSCHYEVSAPDDAIGNYVLCPSCFTRLQIPPPRTNESIEQAQAADQIYGVRIGEAIKEYKDTMPVYCKLCHTLMYASAERIGSHLICPDCGTKTLILPAGH